MSEKLVSEQALTNYRTMFDQLDLDHNGFLDQYEFSCFLTSIKLDPRLAPACFKIFDTNTDGKLSFDEFVNYLKSCEESQKDPRIFYKLVFDAVDKDKNGSIDANEIKEFLNLLGIPVSLELAEEQVKQLDQNGNGLVEFGEICDSLGL